MKLYLKASDFKKGKERLDILWGHHFASVTTFRYLSSSICMLYCYESSYYSDKNASWQIWQKDDEWKKKENGGKIPIEILLCGTEL